MKLTTQRGRPARQVDESSNADRAVSSLRARWVPFAPPVIASALGPLALGVALRLALTHSVAGVALTTGGVIALTTLLALAVFHGIGARRRLFTRWHATLTVVAAGLGVAITVAIGIPRGWAFACVLVGAAFGVSWALPRTDALRHDPALDLQERDGWGNIIGLANSPPGKPEVHDARVEIPVKHGPGDTRETVQGALNVVASAMNAVPGRSRVVGGAHAGESTMVIVTRDALKIMAPWAGVSAMGDTIAKPILVGMREDGRPGQLWLPGDPKAQRPLSHELHAGMPGYGKTFGARLDFADAVTRRDCVGLWLDSVKGAQGSMGIRRGCTGYVTDKAVIKALIRRLTPLVLARADLMGRHGHAEWTERTFTELGLPLLVVHCEEADDFINTAAFKFLVNKARSAGVVIVASMQRLDHGSIDTSSRAAMGTAFCYAVDNDYSAAMVLSEATLKAGIDPTTLKELPAGHFYLEAPGTPSAEWSLLHRRFTYEPDHMTREIDRWVGSGEMAQLSDLDKGALTLPIWEAIRGDRADTFNVLVTAPVDHEKGKAVDIAPINAEIVDDDEDNDEDFDDDDETFVIPVNPDEDAAKVDGRVPIAPLEGEDIEIVDPLPEAASQEEAEEAFDDQLRAYVEKGKTEVTGVEFAEDFKYRSRTWLTRRLAAVADGAIVRPGITLERHPDQASRYIIILLRPRTDGSDGA